MIRIRNITLPFGHSNTALTDAIAKKLSIYPSKVYEVALVRKSIDARQRSRVNYVYTVDASIEDETAVLKKVGKLGDVSNSPDMHYQMPKPARDFPDRPVVVGFGPCGMFAALVLAQAGAKPIVIERGKDVNSRIKDVQDFWKTGKLDPESNAQFGEGGAGTFSDGKLTTQIKDKSNRSRKVLAEFVQAGAPEEILYQAKPHIGTDNLVRVVKNIREKIISLGGEVRFNSKLTDIKFNGSSINAVVINDSQEIAASKVVLAIGHSARDTFYNLHELGLAMEAKPFAVGVRIEHPQTLIDTAQYGKFAGTPGLGAADYKLVHHCANGRSAFTFCMCPGGEVIACSSEPNTVVTNGMSIFARSKPNANSALLVGVEPKDFGNPHPLAGIEFQRKWERRAFEVGGSNYNAPVQLVGDFLAGKPSTNIAGVKPSYTPSTLPCDLRDCLPDFVSETLKLALPQLDKKLKGFAMKEAVMTAIESRSSSPVRILRGDTLESISNNGVYPAGEGAGYAGGIISAAIDGIKAAEAIIANLS